MGSNVKTSFFNDKVTEALKDWQKTAKKHKRQGRHSEGVSPQSSRPATPSYRMSPVHLLQSYDNHTPDMSPEASNFDNERWYGEGSATSVTGKKNDDGSATSVTGKKNDDENDQTESFELRVELDSVAGRTSSPENST